MDHCIAKICEIANRPDGDSRAIFQLGYNLGRLSEMTGLGRGAFWDLWNGAAAEWNEAVLKKLALELHDTVYRSRNPTERNDQAESTSFEVHMADGKMTTPLPP